jgi:hypothetical protein
MSPTNFLPINRIPPKRSKIRDNRYLFGQLSMESAGFSIIFLVVSGFLKIERNLFDREFPIINKEIEK